MPMPQDASSPVRRTGSKLHVTYKVRGYHIDINGHVNNAVYLNYLEDARDDFLESLGLSLPDLQAQGILVVLAEVRIKYHRPALYGDRIEVWGWLCELRRVKSTWKMDIRQADSGHVLAEAWVRSAFLNELQQIIPIPEFVRERFEPLHVPDVASRWRR